MKRFFCSLAALALSAGWIGARAASAPRPPNLVVFLIDDLGVRDTACYNPDTFYETPNIDRLAREGVRFTNGYAANPVCSPTRYSIVTGKYPTRGPITNYIPGERSAKFLPAPFRHNLETAEITFAEVLRTAGYRTLFVGKWHLGEDAAHWPEAQGFDVNIGGWSRGAPKSYFPPYENPRLSDGPPGEHLTDRLAQEATRLIEESKDRPFVLYYADYAVHIPLAAPTDLVAKYEQKAARLGLKPGPGDFATEEQVWPGTAPRQVRIRQNHPTYAALVEVMDRAVGRVLAKLDELGLANNTLVIFTGDNGGLSTAEGLPTSNLPLRGGKGWIYEGGIREPWIVRWPGVVRPNSTSDEPVMSIDIFPTLVAAAGVDRATWPKIDGLDLRPVFAGQSLSRDSLYWHYPHYSNQGGFPGGAIRQGDWKLIERFEDGRIQLFNLEWDPGERDDVAAGQPQLVAQLRNELHRWYADTGALFLQPKPAGPAPWHP